jgi:hypothetical protein
MASYSLRRFFRDTQSPLAIGQRSPAVTTDQGDSTVPSTESVATKPVQALESSKSPPASPSSVASSTVLSRADTNLSSTSSTTTVSETTSITTVSSIDLGPPGPTLDQQTFAMSIHGSNYPCIFKDILKCDNVDLDGFDEWFEHHIDHFGPQGPPAHGLCVFCNRSFERIDAMDCWTEYLSHIYDHFQNGWNLNHRRPDFRVLRDLWRKGLMGDDVYGYICEAGSERPPVAGLRPLDWVPEETVSKRMREDDAANRVIIVESRRQIRDRRRLRG